MLSWGVCQSLCLRGMLLLAALLLLAGAPARIAGEICRAELAARVASLLADGPEDRPRAHFGLLARHGETVLLDVDSRTYTPAASNNKLLTTVSTFLDFPGVAERATLIGVRDAGADGGFEVCIRGDGDPGLTTASLEAANVTDKVVEAVGGSGAHVATVAVDNRLFGGKDAARFFHPPTWEWDDMAYYYGAPLSAASLNENAARVSVKPGATIGAPGVLVWSEPLDAKVLTVLNDVTTVAGDAAEVDIYLETASASYRAVGTIGINATSAPSGHIAIQRPDEYVTATFKAILENAGVTVAATASSCSFDVGRENATVIIPGADQDALYSHLLLTSDNMFTETFSRLAAVEANGGSAVDGDPKTAGVAAVRASLIAHGVAGDSFQQMDGSGLSRRDMLTPEALVETLALVQDSETYRSYLPVAGESGTLAHRFVDTPLQGRLQAKTGTLTGVTALSGFMPSAHMDGDIIFSMVVSESTESASVLRDLFDEIALLIYDSKVCGGDCVTDSDCLAGTCTKRGHCKCHAGFSGATCNNASDNSGNASSTGVIVASVVGSLAGGIIIGLTGAIVYTRLRSPPAAEYNAMH